MFKVWGLDVVTLGYLNQKSTQNECLIVSFFQVWATIVAVLGIQVGFGAWVWGFKV